MADVTAETLLGRLSPIKVAVDEEYNAEEWWDALRARRDGKELEKAIDEGAVTSAQLEILKSLPGWDDGPEFAAHPLLIQ